MVAELGSQPSLQIIPNSMPQWLPYEGYLCISLAPMGFPGSPDGKESACYAGDTGSFPGSGRSPGDVNGYPLQYSCLENPMDRGAC